jgi:hypothetical protein
MIKPILFHKLPPRSLESVREGLKNFRDSFNYIYMTMFRKLSEGEPLAHPQFFEILKMIRKEYPDTLIDIKTNGFALTKDYIKKLSKFNPIGIEITYMSDDPKIFSKIIGVSPKYHATVRKALPLLKEYGFTINPRITPVPKLGGWEDIEKAVKYLIPFSDSVEFNYMTYSRFTSQKMIDFLKIEYDDEYERVMGFAKKYDFDIHLLPDLYEPLKFHPKLVMMGTALKKYKNVLWMFSTGAYDRGKKIVEQVGAKFPNNHYAVHVKPNFIGGNIVSAGLTMVSDYIEALEKVDYPYDLILLPASTFDLNGQDLMNKNVQKIKEKFGVDYWIITDREDYIYPYEFMKKPENQYRQSCKETLKDFKYE